MDAPAHGSRPPGGGETEKGRAAPSLPVSRDQSKVQKSSTLVLSTMNRSMLVLSSTSSPL